MFEVFSRSLRTIGVVQCQVMVTSDAMEETMNQQQFPKGWDAQRVKQLIDELDARSDEEWIAADEAITDGGDSDIGDER